MKLVPLLVIAALVSACQTLPGSLPSAPTMKSMSVDGGAINYLEQGEGIPVVLVHGAASDHRIWERQRDAISARYRFIALDQRYFGKIPWPDDGSRFSQATHVADLAAFIRGLNAGPVHLVGRSYGASVVLVTAVRHPELVRSVFAHEGTVMSLITDDAERKAILEDRKGIATVSTAAKAGNAAQATGLLLEFVNDLPPGSFDGFPAPAKTMHLDNARTTVLLVSSPPPPRVTCAEFGQLRMPVTLSNGEISRSSFKGLIEAQHRCLPAAKRVIIPGARHSAPSSHPAAFNAALLAFLERN